MKNKGQSISINTIIVAAIALAVLVVLFVIFTGRLGIFSKGVGEATDCNVGCRSAGYASGTPVDELQTECGLGSGKPPLPGYSVIVDGVRKKCCCS